MSIGGAAVTTIGFVHSGQLSDMCKKVENGSRHAFGKHLDDFLVTGNRYICINPGTWRACDCCHVPTNLESLWLG